ncbi:unnamed protein product [Prunus armeniaca]
MPSSALYFGENAISDVHGIIGEWSFGLRLPLKSFYDKFRKEKAVHKTATTDDKRLQSTIKRIGHEHYSFNQVNIFMDDVVIQSINPRGPDNSDNLMKLAEQFQKQAPGAGAGAAGGTTPQEDDDDEVPELVSGEAFEAAEEEKQAS